MSHSDGDAGRGSAVLLVLLCRPPGSPNSKTRLAADVGTERARQLYERCLDAVLASASEVAVDLRVAVAGPPLALATWCARHTPEAELVRQRGGTFAERQRNELRRGLADGYARVAVMASDLPVIRAVRGSSGGTTELMTVALTATTPARRGLPLGC
jgi:glycosyltransferase A (GT-A) superfamily protein (DUF2064 family)